MTDDQNAAVGDSATDRKDVRKFFSIRIKKIPDKRPMSWPIVWTITVMAAAIGGIQGGVGAFFVLSLVGFVGTIAVDRVLASGEVDGLRTQNEANEEELRKLAEITRRVQTRDRTKAILRVFDRTQIDRDKLRVLDHVYIFEGEEQLLESETRDRKLGDLINKSIQFVTPADHNKWLQPVIWPEGNKVEYFFNPVRLVILFLTETQLVICDVQIDSIDGDLREEIQRVSLAKIVNLRFIAERIRYPLKRDEIVRWAENLNFNQEKIEEIKRSADDKLESDWTLEKLTSSLSVSRTDGGAITMPIRSSFYFGSHRSALDDDDSLGEVETKVDRMINELNRLVETS